MDFMSREQALNLLEKEIANGLYPLPIIARLTERERNLRDAGLPIDSAITMKQLQIITNARTSKQKYRGLCYQIPIKVIEPKLKMVCLLQNITITQKYHRKTKDT